MKIRYIIAFVAFLLTNSPIYGQIPTQAQAQKELQKRGINELEFRNELLKRGVDIDNVDPTDPIELARVEKIVREVMAEMEAKSKTSEVSTLLPSGTTTTPETTLSTPAAGTTVLNLEENIKDAVNDGATLEEAISEELQQKEKEKLPDAQVFGHHIFRNSSVKFYRKSEDAKPPNNYIIGPGDQLSIAIWGESELNFSQVVSSDGFIKPVGVPRIYVTGLTIAEAKQTMKRKLSRFYRFNDNTYEVNVTTARVINVNITGEVFNVGSYSLSALNTAFNALVAAGGPSDIGSVRNIVIARAGGATRKLDMYKFLSNPLSNEEYYLNENDYILVPVAEKVVDVRGAINRPFKYELLEKENLKDLIFYAGGLKANAMKRSIQITRIENDDRKIINVNLNELEAQNRDFPLKKGDLINIVAIPTEPQNVVQIDGTVDLPGEYAFVEGMRISDLLEVGQLEDGSILSTSYLMRLNPDQTTVRYEVVDISEVLKNKNSKENILLQRGDKLTIRAKSSFVDRKTIEVSGAVRIEGTYPYNGGELRVSDALFLSGGLAEDATDFAFIFRNQIGQSSPEYINVDLARALSGEVAANVVMKPGDKLVVYDKNQYTQQSYVSISGAVKQVKEITYDTSLTIKKALLLAGGLAFDASMQQIDVFRLDFAGDKKTRTLVANVSVDKNLDVLNGGDFKLAPFDQVIVRKAPEFELQRNIRVEGEVRFPGQYALLSDNTKLSEIIKLAGGGTEEAFFGGATLKRSKDGVGFVIIDLPTALKKPKSEFNAILQEGDVLTIPKKNDLVTVIGAVAAEDAFTSEIASAGKYSFVYEKGKNAKYYVDKYAGGVSKDGKASRITVSYPNGELRKTTRFLFINNYPKVIPGSVISVGYKDVKAPEGEKGQKEDIDWGKVLSDSVAQATTILTLVILINNLN